MIVLGLWLGEFVLEASGAFFAFRRRLTVLAVYLAFSAVSDAILFIVLKRFGGDAYGYGSWAQEAVQYLLLIALASQLVSSWIRESGTAKLTLWAAVIGGILTIKAFILADSWPHRFLDAEIAASMSAGVVVCLGWLTRKKPLERIQAGIVAGLVISLAGNGFCAMLWQVWDGARYLYPIPASAALVVWNWAASQRKIAEYRRDVPPKFEPTRAEPMMLSRRVQ